MSETTFASIVTSRRVTFQTRILVLEVGGAPLLRLEPSISTFSVTSVEIEASKLRPSLPWDVASVTVKGRWFHPDSEQHVYGHARGTLVYYPGYSKSVRNLGEMPAWLDKLVADELIKIEGIDHG